MEEELSSPKNGGKFRKLMNNNNNGCHKHQDIDEEDKLSSLFDPLLVEILSFLPIESAAATSALSRRWRYLWTQITSFRFFSDKHLSAVNHILPQLTSPLIRKLVIPVSDSDQGRLTPSITSCFDHIRHRDDVEVIEVSVNGSEIILPSWVFQCQSLVSLDLCGECNFELARNCDLPNLKKLSLELNYSGSNLIATLFNSCPLLEELWVEFLLSLEIDEHLVDISAPNLKCLSIALTDWGPLRLKFVINTPKLVQISIADYYSSSSYSFVTIPSRLEKAHLTLMPEGEDEGGPTTLVSNLVQAVSSVCSLELRDCIKVFNYLGCMDGANLPIFRNLTLLQVDFEHELGCWKNLLLSLRRFPNLEILKVSRRPIEDKEEEEEDWSGLESLPTHSISRLKILEIKQPLYDNDTQLIRYILSNINSLERLSLEVSVKAKEKKVRLWKEYEFCESLFKLPRSSSTCRIELHGDYIHASSTRPFSDGLLACHLWYGAPKH